MKTKYIGLITILAIITGCGKENEKAPVAPLTQEEKVANYFEFITGRTPSIAEVQSLESDAVYKLEGDSFKQKIFDLYHERVLLNMTGVKLDEPYFEKYAAYLKSHGFSETEIQIYTNDAEEIVAYRIALQTDKILEFFAKNYLRNLLLTKRNIAQLDSAISSLIDVGRKSETKGIPEVCFQDYDKPIEIIQCAADLN